MTIMAEIRALIGLLTAMIYGFYTTEVLRIITEQAVVIHKVLRFRRLQTSKSR